MDLEGFSNKDKGIITRNPEATPYELLEHGLSQKGYDRLISANEQEKVEKQNQEAEQDEEVQTTPSEKKSNVLGVTVEPVKIDVSAPKQKGGRNKAKALSVLVRDKKTGREFSMSAYNARLLDKKKFEILA